MLWLALRLPLLPLEVFPHRPQPSTVIAGERIVGDLLHLLRAGLARPLGPECIESGGWDAGEAGSPGDVRRNYFVAMSAHQEYLWIFTAMQAGSCMVCSPEFFLAFAVTFSKLSDVSLDAYNIKNQRPKETAP